MGAVTPRAGLPTWADHTAFLRRHRGLLALAVALGGIAGAVWSWQQPSTFSATASVALAPVPVYVAASTDELVPPEVSVDTDAQLLRSGPVLDAVGGVLGIDREAAEDRLRVTATANTRVLHVTARGDTPQHAAAAANAAVAALTDVRRQSLGALDEDQVRYLRMVLGEHDVAPEQDDEQAFLVPMEDEQFARIVGVRASLDELDEARARPAEVVRPAVPPMRADYANAEVAVVSGALLGLLAGCLAGAGRDRLRTPSGPTTHHHTHDEDLRHA